MREIKFRGKRIDNGEWVYGYYYRETVKDDRIFPEYAHYIIIVEDGMRTFVRVDPWTVGQYTGRRSSNKKDIYEGDIVEATWCDGEKATGVISFNWRSADYNIYGPRHRFIAAFGTTNTKYRVVDNIYEEKDEEFIPDALSEDLLDEYLLEEIE